MVIELNLLQKKKKKVEVRFFSLLGMSLILLGVL